jgi:hypothetical protein
LIALSTIHERAILGASIFEDIAGSFATDSRMCGRQPRVGDAQEQSAAGPLVEALDGSLTTAPNDDLVYVIQKMTRGTLPRAIAFDDQEELTRFSSLLSARSISRKRAAGSFEGVQESFYSLLTDIALADLLLA